MNTRRLAALALPLLLASCTQAELSNILPQPIPPEATKPAAMTFRLDNLGASTRPCTSMTAQLALTASGSDLGGGPNVQSPDVQAGEAWSRTLTPDELAGSTFSVTNIGSIGALFSFPIINVPDAAILGVHSIVKRPIVNERDEIVVAHMMYLSLSFDHRLVDGAEAARFCKEVIRLLENPDRLMLEAM